MNETINSTTKKSIKIQKEKEINNKINKKKENLTEEERLKEIEIIKVSNRWDNAPKLNYNSLCRWYPKFAVDEFCKRRGIKPKELGVPDEKEQEEKEIKEENDKSYIEYVDKELKEGDNDRFFNVEYDKKTGKIISKKINIEFTATYLTDKYNFKTIYGEKTDKIRLYDGRIFSKGARGLIKSQCEKILKSYAKKNVVEEIFDKIKRKTKTTEEEFSKTNLYLIPLENGCYNIKTKKLEPHSPKNNFTFYSPIEYNPKAKCKNWFKFIHEALYPADIKIAKQWFGFNLFRQYFIKKALILLGKKDTGKTIFLDTLISFVGEKNKCGLSLQKISSGSDFTKFALLNKLSNIYDDLSSADINDGGAFKIATGGGYISAEEKFGEFVQFKSYAKISLAGNKAPPVKDNDDNAYFSRFIPLIFENVPEKPDPFLRDKIQTKEEMSGILNWALEGLHELLKTGSFSNNKTDEEIKKIMEMSGDILIQFGTEVLEQSEKQISKEDMYKIYCFWANENDKPILSKEQLGRRLNQKIKYLVPKTGAKKRFWGNVSLNSKWTKKFKEFEEKNNSQRENNTLDTFSNFTRNISKKVIKIKNKGIKINNIKSENVSKTTKEKDILSVNSKKILSKKTEKTDEVSEINFEDSDILEDLKDE